MKVKKRACPFELKSLDEKGVFTGYASVFGVVDSWDDVVLPGAFVESLTKRRPALLWQHRSEWPIGVWESMIEDQRGLLSVGRLLIDDLPRAREAYALLKAGAMDGLSIGYEVVNCDFVVREEKTIRQLRTVDLWEVSLVTFPANEDATVTGIKAIENMKTVRDAEEFLRDAGLSRSEAKAVIGRVKSALRREAEEDALVLEAGRLLETIKGGTKWTN